MNLGAAIDRILAVLETRMPDALDEVLAETAGYAVALVELPDLGGFEANLSPHTLRFDGTNYGPVSGATREEVLAALHALASAVDGEGEPVARHYAARLTGTGTAARLTILPGVVPETFGGSVVTSQDYEDQVGDLREPGDYRRATDDLPELNYPSVQVAVEGEVDETRYWTPQADISHPLAISVVGFLADSEDSADRIGWVYGEAVRRVLRRYARGGGVIDWVEVDTDTVVLWGEGAHGRSAVVRATAKKWGAEAA